MHRILYISPGPVPPDEDRQKNKFYHLSRHFTGDVLAPVWWAKREACPEKLTEINAAMGNFKYHMTYSSRLPKLIKFFWDIFFYVLRGSYLHYFKAKYDIIIAYGPFKTGLAAYILKKLTGAKLIIEIPGELEKAFSFEKAKPSLTEKLKRRLSNLLTPFIINGADSIRLLYPTQLNGCRRVRKGHVATFHDFVPISILNPHGRSEKYLLFLGHPWFLKGVDVLINAFNLISHEFPGYRLKIVGWCTDKKYFQELAGDNTNIELLDPVFHEEAMQLMSGCSLFILPSRTETMGRVLLEAWAFKKPVIASRVGGIPHYVKHGVNGLLFESENARDLAEKIRTILSNPEYAANLAENGYKYVHEDLSEARYVEHFKNAVTEIF